jgi:hypothetical protein
MPFHRDPDREGEVKSAEPVGAFGCPFSNPGPEESACSDALVDIAP